MNGVDPTEVEKIIYKYRREYRPSKTPAQSRVCTLGFLIMAEDPDVVVAAVEIEKENKSKVRDIRRYYCEFCGICRSKKALIRSHILSDHKGEVQDEDDDAKKEVRPGAKRYKCEECDVSFKKPAYLLQHMQGHSIERPFSCPLNDCHHSYRRKDHLARHMLSHQGKLFICPVESCNKQFAFQTNMKRHVDEFHDEEDSECDKGQEKLYTCPEVGCGKTFQYPSKLRKHEDSHIKLYDGVEIICGEPGCMKFFTNSDCLKEHIHSCHRYIKCFVCGTQQLKKHFKRHMQTHEQGSSNAMLSCSFSGCLHKFANKSNLTVHLKAIHLEERPFACRISGCEKKFSYKHVRDNHEKSGIHVYVHRDFLEADEQFRQRDKGGRKRKPVDVETLWRKRVSAPSEQSSVLDNPSDYLRWLLDDDDSQ